MPKCIELLPCDWLISNLYYYQAIEQGCVQPRNNGAKHLLNRNGGVLNILFWWRKCWNYGSWEGHSLCSFWRIFGAWWNRYKYVFNATKYARSYSHCRCRLWKLWFLSIVIQLLPRISGWKDKHFRWRVTHSLRDCVMIYMTLFVFCEY